MVDGLLLCWAQKLSLFMQQHWAFVCFELSLTYPPHPEKKDLLTCNSGTK